MARSRFIYPFWKPTAPNIFTIRRIQNWESTPSYEDEGLSLQGHSEGVARNKTMYRAELGSRGNKVFSKEVPNGEKRYGKRRSVVFEEKQRTATTVTQTNQCAWIKWNDIELNELWKSLIDIETLTISFRFRSIYDFLPNANNLRIMGIYQFGSMFFV